MPAVSTLFKSFQVGRFCHLLLSCDELVSCDYPVRNLANAKANREADDNHHKFQKQCRSYDHLTHDVQILNVWQRLTLKIRMNVNE